MTDLVKLARQRIDDTQRTHWDGCERDHRECLIQRMADEIERLREALDGAVALNNNHLSREDVYQNEIERLRATIEDLTSDLARDREEIERLRAERGKLEHVNAELNVELSRLYACRNELQDVTQAMDDPVKLGNAIHDAMKADSERLRDLRDRAIAGGLALLSGDEIEKLRALLRKTLPHIEGNVGSWESERSRLSSQGQMVADQRIAEGNALIAAIHREARK